MGATLEEEVTLMSSYLFTSESVGEGHPDKVCDAISDAVLDACLEQDPLSRVACETFCKTGFVIVGGEITTKASVDFGRLARSTIRDIGYTSSAMGFDWESCGAHGHRAPVSRHLAGRDRG